LLFRAVGIDDDPHLDALIRSSSFSARVMLTNTHPDFKMLGVAETTLTEAGRAESCPWKGSESLDEVNQRMPDRSVYCWLRWRMGLSDDECRRLTVCIS